MAQMRGDNPWLCWPPRKWKDAKDIPAGTKGVPYDSWARWLMHEAPESARRGKKSSVECNQESEAVSSTTRKAVKGASDEPNQSQSLFG